MIFYKKHGQQLSNTEDSLDQTYFKTSEAKELIEGTVEKAKREVKENKRELLATFLANSATGKLSKSNEKRMIVDTIDKRTPLQISVLK